MIYIWDNGGDFSAHTIAFIEHDESSDLERLLNLMAECESIGDASEVGVLAKVQTIEWLRPNRTTTLYDLLRTFTSQWLWGKTSSTRPDEIGLEMRALVKRLCPETATWLKRAYEIDL